MFKQLIVAMLATLFWGAANAGINFDESGISPDGDFSHIPANFVTIDLTAGTNVVSGHAYLGEGGTDFDGFFFRFGAGLTLTDILFSPSHADVNATTLLSTWLILAADGTGLGSGPGTADILGPDDQILFSGFLPLSAGTYQFRHTSYTFVSNGNSSWDYDIVFELAQGNQVPEPGSLALIGLGFAGLALKRRRKKPI